MLYSNKFIILATVLLADAAFGQSAWRNDGPRDIPALSSQYRPDDSTDAYYDNAYDPYFEDSRAGGGYDNPVESGAYDDPYFDDGRSGGGYDDPYYDDRYAEDRYDAPPQRADPRQRTVSRTVPSKQSFSQETVIKSNDGRAKSVIIPQGPKQVAPKEIATWGAAARPVSSSAAQKPQNVFTWGTEGQSEKPAPAVQQPAPVLQKPVPTPVPAPTPAPAPQPKPEIVIPPEPALPAAVKNCVEILKTLQLSRLAAFHAEGQNWRWILDNQKKKTQAMKIPAFRNYVNWVPIDFARVFGHYDRYRDVLIKAYPMHAKVLGEASFEIEKLSPLPQFATMTREERLKAYLSLAKTNAEKAYNLIQKSSPGYFSDPRVKTLLANTPILKKELGISSAWIHSKLTWVIKHLGNAHQHAAAALQGTDAATA